LSYFGGHLDLFDFTVIQDLALGFDTPSRVLRRVL
jgi:hypothetical protein